MKFCPKCAKSLDISSFYQRKKGPRAGEFYEKCKECMKLRGRSYYLKNRERQLALAKKRRSVAYQEKRNFIKQAKNQPCADCGKRYPFYVMDFDHRNHKNKINNVSSMFTGNWALQKIKNEAIKCDIVCANCHRIRTYAKLNLR